MDRQVEYQISGPEVEILLNDLLDIYGYDFTSYSRASLVRRINRLFALDRHPSFAEFRYRYAQVLLHFGGAGAERGVVAFGDAAQLGVRVEEGQRH